eukprot:TRINITY_DN20777_c0_g1_i1.p1 TRINITY_DN20777_c0_g1~~TRINITY_DN20777_c0_g1_i1.p1  ORF type:complete len:468 (+),score=147.82 TRINITY_DN20777_c0_g1_i1:97-1500(+)
MLAPLGPHISSSRPRLPQRARAPASTYVASVWVHAGEEVDGPRCCISVRIPNAATVEQALALCWAQFHAAESAIAAGPVAAQRPVAGMPAPLRAPVVATNPDGSPCTTLPQPSRPAHQYVLLQAYADGRVNPTMPFLHMLEPLAEQLEFPYMIALCPDPFVVLLAALERREGERRAAIMGAWLSFADWAAGYSQLLRNVMQAAHSYALAEHGDRVRLLRAERAAYFAIRERELCREERAARTRAEGAERGARGFLAMLHRFGTDYVAERAAAEAAHLAGLARLHADTAEQLARLRRVEMLRARCSQLLLGLVRAFDLAAQRKRMLYADSAVAHNLSQALRQGVSPYAQWQLRLDLSRAAKGCEEDDHTPSLADIDTVNGDEFSSTWLRRQVVEKCGGLTLRRRRLSITSLTDSPLLWHSHHDRAPPSPDASMAEEVMMRKCYLGPGGQRSVAFPLRPRARSALLSFN